MAFYLKYMLCVFVVSSIISTGFAIKCFTCRSDYDPKCADPFDNSTIPITDCAVQLGVPGFQSTMCRKIRHKVNGDWRFIRECATVNNDGVGVRGDERVCIKKTESNNIYTEYCTCNSKDGCNSSFTFKASSLLLAFLVLPALVVKVLS